jgi:hypothetical protein
MGVFLLHMESMREVAPEARSEVLIWARALESLAILAFMTALAAFFLATLALATSFFLMALTFALFFLISALAFLVSALALAASFWAFLIMALVEFLPLFL